MDRISDHISYNEATRSMTAKRRGIKNIPLQKHVENMKLLAEKIFEPIRSHFNTPIYIGSMFRSTELNKAIGGAHTYKRGVYVPTSQHCEGEAMDLDADVYGKVTNEQLFSYIKDNLTFDQLIAEGVEEGHVEWVHVSYKSNESENRKQVLIMYREKGKTKYLPYNEDNWNKFIK